jgi:hypothetical protein
MGSTKKIRTPHIADSQPLRTSLLLGIVYITFSQFSVIFGQVHGFSEHQVGLTFTGLGIGMVAGTSLAPVFNAIDRRKAAECERKGEKLAPEIALYPAMLGAILAPIGKLTCRLGSL